VKDIARKNLSRFPVVERGVRVQILDAKMPVLNGLEGIIIEAPSVPRSPHKAIYKVNVAGKLAVNNPWYLFRTEFQPLT
jgi:hypothetical protein